MWYFREKRLTVGLDELFDLSICFQFLHLKESVAWQDVDGFLRRIFAKPYNSQIVSYNRNKRKLFLDRIWYFSEYYTGYAIIETNITACVVG